LLHVQNLSNFFPSVNKPREGTHIDQLDRLRQLTKARSNLGPWEHWSHHQYECLRELIHQDTGVLLSTNTLKRVFGKIPSDSTASKSTLNTLAKYCGYADFVGFLKNTSGKTQSAQNLEKKKNKSPVNHPVLLISVGSLLILLVIFLGIRECRFHKALELAEITPAYEGGAVPFTQIYHYKFNPRALDSIYFREYEKGRIGLSTRDSVFSWVHFIPGYREVRFFARGKEIWKDSYMVRSDGWILISPWGSLEPRKYISLSDSSGTLGVSRDLLAKNEIDLSDDGGWVHYFNMKEYGVDGSAFSFQAKFRNKLTLGFQQCQDVIIRLECEQVLLTTHFTQLGCQKFAELSLGNERYEGEKHDLTALTLDFNEWQDIRIVVKDRHFRIYHDTQLLLDKELNTKPGKLTGLHFSFRGLGEVDDILIQDSQNQPVYSENFEKKQYDAY
jgi:hypothetical protein